MTHSKKIYDICIIGGGVTGTSLAYKLSQTLQSSSFRVALVSNQAPPPASSSSSDQTLSKPHNHNDSSSISSRIPSARAYALSPASLKTCGYYDDERMYNKLKDNIGKYTQMQVWESNGPGLLQFDESHLLSGGDDGDKMLGAVVEDEVLVRALREAIVDNNNENNNYQSSSSVRGMGYNKTRIDLIDGANIEKVTYEDGALSDNYTPLVNISYKNKTCNDDDVIGFKAKLIVATDGSNSFIRRQFNFPVVRLPYNRSAVISSVKVDTAATANLYNNDTNNNRSGTAFQRFFPTGPIALLPTCNPNYGNLIWSTTPEHAKELVSMTNEDFTKTVNDAFNAGPAMSPPLLKEDIMDKLPDFLRRSVRGAELLGRSIGDGLALISMNNMQHPFMLPPRLVEPSGPRFSFPLQLQHVREYTKPRVVLVGDSAHTVHPMAGQGLNLGFSDVESLVSKIETAVKSGMEPSESYFLKQYESDRQAAVLSMMGGIQFLHGAFSTEFSPAVWLRSIGVNVVNLADPVKTILADIATTGGTGRNYNK